MGFFKAFVNEIMNMAENYDNNYNEKPVDYNRLANNNYAIKETRKYFEANGIKNPSKQEIKKMLYLHGADDLDLEI